MRRCKNESCGRKRIIRGHSFCPQNTSLWGYHTDLRGAQNMPTAAVSHSRKRLPGDVSALQKYHFMTFPYFLLATRRTAQKKSNLVFGNPCFWHFLYIYTLKTNKHRKAKWVKFIRQSQQSLFFLWGDENTLLSYEGQEVPRKISIRLRIPRHQSSEAVLEKDVS